MNEEYKGWKREFMELPKERYGGLKDSFLLAVSCFVNALPMRCKALILYAGI